MAHDPGTALASMRTRRRSLTPGCLYALAAVFGVPFFVVTAFAAFGVFGRYWVGFGEFATGSWLGAGVAFTVAMLAHHVSQRLYARRVLALMTRTGAASTAPGAPAREADGRAAGATPVGALPPGALDVAGAPPPLAPLRIDTVTALREVPADPAGAALYHRLRNRGQRTLLAGVLAGLATSQVASWILLSKIPPPPPDAQDPADPFFLPRILLVPLAITLVIVLASYHERQRLGPVTIVLAGLLPSWWVPFAASFLTDTNARALLFLPAACYVLLVLLAFGMVSRDALNRAGAQAPRLRLLVLRAFGIDHNTQSLFQRLGRRWTFVGPVLTVIDPTFAAFEFSRSQRILLVAVFTPAILLGTAFSHQTDLVSGMASLGVVLYIPILMAFFLVRVQRVGNEASHNLEAVRVRLAFEGEARRPVPRRLLCFADTWQDALGELVGWADLVLMDLRGFADRHRGVQFELDYLLDHVPLARTVFLTNARTDGALLESSLADAWGALSPTSPNRALKDPVIVLHRMEESARRGGGTDAVMAALSEAGAGVPLRPHRVAPTGTRAAWVARLPLAIAASWALVAAGVALEFMFSNGARFYSGTSIAWLGIAAVMLSTRLRTVVMRDGNADALFRRGPWRFAFWAVAGSWLIVRLIEFS